MASAIGQTLQNRYRIVALLGQGGMGAVYLAEDLRLPGRRCAIKENVPDPQASPQALDQLRQQFQAEASVLSQLDHPNLPKVSDYFTQGGNEYLVMDFVAGENLQSVLDRWMQQHRQPLPERTVLPWIDQVLDALAYLHSQHPYAIIHRDIKPGNIILTPNGTVKLVDFGLVKLLDPNRPGTAMVVKGFGTPEYAALEQHGQGTYGHTDARTDIYALGATLYHLVTGAAPPDSVQLAVKPGSLIPPRRANPALSPAVESAILQALQTQPDQRFQTAVAMRAALAGSAAFSLARSKQRLPGWLPGAAVGAVLVIMITLGWQAFGPQPSPATPVPVAEVTPAPPPVDTPAPPTPIPPTRTPTPSANTPLSPTDAPIPPSDTPEPRTPTPTLSIGFTMTSEVDGMALVYMPAGEFLMGTRDDQVGEDDERPQHTVNLDSYWIDETEVTAAQYQRCVTAGVCSAPDTSFYCTFGADGKSNHPVNCVDWNEATIYCDWVGRRLPTEAEWEKAARSMDGRIYPWGDVWDVQTVPRLNFSDKNDPTGPSTDDVDDGFATTAPVGSFPAGASPYGPLDMAGNVWEWMADWYDGGYYAQSSRDNPIGPGSSSARVLRGGSWSNSAFGVRAANRYWDAPGGRSGNVGFRCARSP